MSNFVSSAIPFASREPNNKYPSGKRAANETPMKEKLMSLKSRAAQMLSGSTDKTKLRAGLQKATPVAAFFTFATMAQADPVTAFFSGIQTTALAVASSIAVIGIIIAAAFHIFGTGRMAETMEKVGVGCFLLGGAGAIATWLFGL